MVSYLTLKLNLSTLAVPAFVNCGGNTFNMGIGIIIAVSADKAENICNWLQEKMVGVEIIGTVVENGHKVTHAIEGVEFTHY